MSTASFLTFATLLVLMTLSISSSSAFFTEGTNNSYVQYPRWQACLNSSISFEFKSNDKNGLLFYTDDGYTDYFELRLRRKKLMLRFKLTKHLGSFVTRDYKDLDDNRWHKVMIQVKKKEKEIEMVLFVDNVKIGGYVLEIDFQFGSLERNHFVYLGGMPATYRWPEHLKYLALPSIMFRKRWSGQMRNLQYSNCTCPLRSAEIMKLSGARRDNLCETNNPCDKNNPNCDCLIDASGKPQCNCKDKSCGPEENACEATVSLVKVGSSDQFGCYPTRVTCVPTRVTLCPNVGTQCWRKCTSCTNNHKWCNISNEKCTKSLYKSAKCAAKHIHNKDRQGYVCPWMGGWYHGLEANLFHRRDVAGYCDFRTGKRYGCTTVPTSIHVGPFILDRYVGPCWRTCDMETDKFCRPLDGAGRNGTCWTNVRNCEMDEDCLVATTKPCIEHSCEDLVQGCGILDPNPNLE